MSEIDLRKLQLVKLEVLKDVTDFCDKYNIVYCLDAGTLLGAARHHGFIPWDDDVDICMDVKNYKRFCRLAPKKMDSKYFIQNFHSDPHCPYTWTKVRLNNTTSMDRKFIHLDINQGIGIDVFAYIGLYKQSFTRKIQKTSYCAYRFLLRKWRCYAINESLSKSKKVIYKILPEKARLFLLDILEKLVLVDTYKNIYCYSSWNVTPVNLKNCYHNNSFKKKSRIKLPFEQYEFWVPGNYEDILESKYGNWHELPPEDQRLGHGDLIVDYHNGSSKYQQIEKKNRTKKIKRRFWKKLTKTKLYNYLPDFVAVSIKYKNHFYKNLNLKDPKTFNEKLQWLKLHDRNPLYTTLVDKYAVKEYIAKKLGPEYVIPTIGAWKSFDDIDFSSLPDQFVLKCTHGSGRRHTIVCKDKSQFDYDRNRELLNTALKTDYYKISREWAYKNVDRKIIAENYLEDEKTHELRDYKFMCFNGEVKCFKIDFGRFIEHHANWYDRMGNLIPYGEECCVPCFDKNLDIPEELPKMIKLAEKLAKGISFVRVDFYYANEKIYFGEMTFYPASGLLPFTEEKWDKQLGEWIKLPKKK